MTNSAAKKTWEAGGVALGIFALTLIISQIAMGKLPIGFDVSTAYLESIQPTNAGSPLELIKGFNLLYLLLDKASLWFHIDSLLLLKIAGVVIPLFLAVMFAVLIYQLFRPVWWAYALCLIMIFFQPAFLRLSWDLYRNSLALAWALASINCLIAFRHKPRWWLILLGGVSLVIAIPLHQMVAFYCALGAAFYALYLISIKISRRPSMQFAYVGVVVIGYLVVSGSIHVLNFSLRTSDVFTQTALVGDLFWLLFISMVPIAILGLKRFHHPVFIALSLALLFQSLSPLLSPANPFFLWDRWMYFLIVPFGILTAAGFVEISAMSSYKKWHRAVFLTFYTAFGITNGVRFLVPSWQMTPATPNSSQTQVLANNFPPTFQWDAIGKEKASDLAQAAAIILENYDGTSPIYTSTQYEGFIHYYLPSLLPQIQIVSQAAVPWMPPSPRYYIFGINYAELAPGTMIAGAPLHEPVQLYDVHQL